MTKAQSKPQKKKVRVQKKAAQAEAKAKRAPKQKAQAPESMPAGEAIFESGVTGLIWKKHPDGQEYTSAAGIGWSAGHSYSWKGIVVGSRAAGAQKFRRRQDLGFFKTIEEAKAKVSELTGLPELVQPSEPAPEAAPAGERVSEEAYKKADKPF